MKTKVQPFVTAARELRRLARAACCAAALAAGGLSGPALLPGAGAAVAGETAEDNWIYLDGSQSSDDYGANLQYHWRQVGGTRVELENSGTARPRFLPPVPGVYAFELIVSNGDAASKPAVVEIEVDRANSAPRADLAPALTLTLGENLVLDGSRSRDPDGDRLVYNWRQLSGTALLSEVAARQSRQSPVITLKPATAGTYEFELFVSDGRENSAPCRCRVEVVRPVSVPVARVSAPKKAVVRFRPAGAPDEALGAPAPAAAPAPAPAMPTPSPAPAARRAAVNAAAPAMPAAPVVAAEAARPEGAGGANGLDGSFEDLSWPNIPDELEELVPSAPRAAATAPAQPVAQPVARVSATGGARARAVPALTAEEVSPAPQAPAPLDRAQPADLAATLAETEAAASSLNASLEEMDAVASGDPVPVRTPQLRVTPAAAPARPRIRMMPAHPADAAHEARLAAEVNVPPVAAVKGNVTAEVGQRVLLEGMGTDVDGDPVTYRWRQTAGPVIPGEPAAQKNIAFIPEEAGTYIFELTVNDGKVDSEPAACAVTVIDNDLGPTARRPAPAKTAAGAMGPAPKMASNDRGRNKDNKFRFWK